MTESIADFASPTTINQDEVDKILRDHHLFVTKKPGGKRADFKRKNLTGLSFAQKNVADADFSYAICVGTNFTGSNLKRALFFGANLTKAKLVRASLIGIDMRGAILKGADLTASDLMSGDFRAGRAGHQGGVTGQTTELMTADSPSQPDQGDMSRATFVNANLSGARMGGSTAQVADFTDAIMRGTRLNNANLKNALMEGANLEGAELTNTNLEGAILRNANLYGANLNAAKTHGADLHNILTEKPQGRPISEIMHEIHRKFAQHELFVESGGSAGTQLDLSGYDLREFRWPQNVILTNIKAVGATLCGATLCNAALQYSDLSGADLRDCDLSYADMRGVNLTGANLIRASLANANLQPLVLKNNSKIESRLVDAVMRHADLSNCLLTDSNLSGADLRDAILTPGTDINGANLSAVIGKPRIPPQPAPKPMVQLPKGIG